MSARRRSGAGGTGLKTRQSPCSHRMFRWELRKANEHATRSPVVISTLKKNTGIKNIGALREGTDFMVGDII